MPDPPVSETPLARKLGIKEGARVALCGASEGFEIVGLPASVVPVSCEDRDIDVALLFAEWERDLAPRFAGLAPGMKATGRLWIAWPKKTSKRPTDLGFGNVQQLGFDNGMVDVKVCAIDEIWTGLCFMVRLTDRAAWTERHGQP
jgi:hypothetical protein